jgi:hypothetical protein
MGLRRFLRRTTLAILLPAGLPAYVTSATLEYSVDDQVTFYINGHLVLERSDFCWADFAVLSTSDGTLPLDVFNMNGDNVLATEDHDTEGGVMGVAYRLTVHHSSGDPVVVWSEPGNTKFLHLMASQKDPDQWYLPNFDDSSWQQAIGAYNSVNSQWVRWYCLLDSAFGVFGSSGCVPEISHMSSGRSNGHDHNLLRNHFSFPNVPAKVRVSVNPPSASRGQSVSFQLIPGKDAAYMDRFQLFARIPQGLRVTSLSKGGYLDPKSSAAFWDFSKADVAPHFVTLNARAVVNAPDWSQPEKVLGPPKYGKVRRQLNVPLVIYNDGAKFGPGDPGWFAMEAPLGIPQGSEILGVIFHSQIRLEGQDSLQIDETDPIYLNYSLDGSQNGALKKDVMVSRSSYSYWIDGYYDATEDRHWTWADLANLRVKFESRQRRLKNTNMAASVSAVIRYYEPLRTAPYFYAMVEASQCDNTQIFAGIRQLGTAAVGSDPTMIALNPGLCAPTPVPMPTPLPTHVPAMVVVPTAEPVHAPEIASMTAGAAIKLGCLENAPEPFKRGGTFVYFCVDKESQVTLNVYDTESGKQLRRMAAGSFHPGKQQIFFNGLDDNGNPLGAGSYLYEILARNDSGAQSRNAHFTRAKN